MFVIFFFALFVAIVSKNSSCGGRKSNSWTFGSTVFAIFPVFSTCGFRLAAAVSRPISRLATLPSHWPRKWANQVDSEKNGKFSRNLVVNVWRAAAWGWRPLRRGCRTPMVRIKQKRYAGSKTRLEESSWAAGVKARASSRMTISQNPSYSRQV